MILSSLGERELLYRLANGHLVVRTGPFAFRIRSSIEEIAEDLSLLYADYALCDSGEFADFSVSLEHGAGIHRWWRKQVCFQFDGLYPFEPLPITHAYPQLEWAMNWCISTHANFFLMLHSAVIERNGFAAVMPAPPGSGKSTLCAALVNRGWRLLSDELALISLDDQSIFPLARPVGLKNDSIGIIKTYAPNAVFNRVTHDTTKGSVTHMQVLPEHVNRMSEAATPRWVIFPKYLKESPATLSPLSKADSMLELGRNSFNYSLLGRNGFDVLAKLVMKSECYQFVYSNFDEAVSTFDSLARSAVGQH